MAVSITLNVTNGATFVGVRTITADVAGVTGGSFRGTLYVDNVAWGSSDLPLTFVLDTNTLGNGSHVLQVRSKYKGVTYKSLNVTVNVANPTSGSVTHSIAAGATLAGTETWTATVTDIDNMSRVDFVVDQTVVGSDSSAPYSFALDTTELAEGNHEFFVSAVQTDGMHTDADVVTAEVQNVIEAAPVNTVAPAITGTAQQGNLLTASGGTWTGTPTPTLAYQWLRCDTAGANCVPITGATSSSYTLVASDVGSKIKVRVRGTNSEGVVDALSAATATVTAIGGSLPVNTVYPTISSGAAMTPFATVIAGFDRPNENPLAGGWTAFAGGNPLQLVSNQMKATVDYSAGYRTTLSHKDYEAGVKLVTVAASANDFEIILRLVDSGGASPIRSSHKQGYGFNFDGKAGYSILKYTAGASATLKANTAWGGGTLADGDQVGCRAYGTTLEVWRKRGAGAWGKEATVTDASHGNAGTVSFGTESIVSTFDDFLGAEITTGAIEEGATLTCSTGTWTGADSYGYQWERCDSAGGSCVAVGTGSTYVLGSSDVGSRIRCRVTAYNEDGSTFVYTALTAAVAAADTGTIPANTVAPTISGTAQVGQTLTANPGTWTGEPAPGYSYQWVRCDSAGTVIGDAVGYTGTTYTALSSDEGKTMRVRVTGSNSTGQVSVTSAASSVIAAVTPPPPPPPSYQNPIGVLRYAGSFGVVASKERYRVYVVSLSDAVAARNSPGIACPYVDGHGVETNYWTGVDYPTALANNWLLRDSSGNLMLGYASKYLADLGSQGYRDEYVRQVLAKTGYEEGVFMDNCLGTLLYLTQNRYPAKYPTQAAWYAVQRDFVLYVGTRFKAAGRYVIANARSDFQGSNDGSTTKTWWQALAPGVSALMNEGWLNGGGLRRWSGTADWRANWEGWQGLVATAQNAGVDFVGATLWPTADTQTMRYCRASMMLDWDGGGGAFMWQVGTNYNTANEPYNINWAIDLGAPTAAKVASGVGWKRTFQNGKVLVNPQNVAATIDGRSLAATDAYLGP